MPRSRNVAPRLSTCSRTTGRTSKPETTAPSRRAVAIACKPATPAPSTSTFAGATVPAAVIKAVDPLAIGQRLQEADQDLPVAEARSLLGRGRSHFRDRIGRVRIVDE